MSIGLEAACVFGWCSWPFDTKRCLDDMFEPDDVDAAFAELDARYVAGEAAAHARTPLRENAATRVRGRIAGAFNLRDLEGLLALATADARYDDRRKWRS